MSEYIVTDANVIGPSGERENNVDIEIRNGRIDRVVRAGDGDPDAFDHDQRFDAAGRLVTPPLIESHTHLYAALTAGVPNWNGTGTLEEGWRLWNDTKEDLTKQNYKDRAKKVARWFAANGVTRVRTHLDVNSDERSEVGLEAMLEVREELAGFVDIQIVAFPMGCLYTGGEEKLTRFEAAMERGLDIVGGIPHREHITEDGNAHVRTVLDTAEKYDAQADLHIDETDDPQSRYTGVLASEALKRGLGERVTASHATALHSYANAYADKLVRIIGESGMNVVTNPMANAVLQGRYDDFPRRRGHTRIEALRDQGVAVGIGQDDIVDHFHSYGDGDPLKAAFVLVHLAHMNGDEDTATLWNMLLEGNAAVFGVNDYGIEAGNEGSLVVYDATDPFDALRTQPVRPLVLRDGNPIAESSRTSTVYEHGMDKTVDFGRR
ncbi:amidohydrolase family protein [Haloarcula sp. S1CR25-12]|uniref:Amidohydrolase family protein n=1 Tax=Haloarcula saliterrae TaxID=2950534 RepID=A0ABU2FFU4_9EURY|nr:amidohydrolase family protein [Haloarcula sp. S1CR25-12]MDS0261135.1 amidohydrolase family protein [Haloarcula sp. S1CR25-12]